MPLTKEFITKNINYTLSQTTLNLPNKRVGKVRDSYDLEDCLVLVTTDRQSAFDRVLAAVPFKGQVLNQTSLWWFKKTAHIVPNHVISSPDENVVIGRKLNIFAVEFVVRAYLTGTTSTSIWTNYSKGVRNYCGYELPDGMTKNQKLADSIVTPTTKSDIHDELTSKDKIIAAGLMTKQQYEYAAQKSLELFEFASIESQKRGLILVDTKFEFGLDSDGSVILADEILTPDSSRYWLADTFEQRINGGLEPENIDKEFLRIWFSNNCDPYNDNVLPDAPIELIVELSLRYIKLYEMITGNLFEVPNIDININDRISTNLANIK